MILNLLLHTIIEFIYLRHLENLQVDRFREDIVQVYHVPQVLPNEGANDCSKHVDNWLDLGCIISHQTK